MNRSPLDNPPPFRSPTSYSRGLFVNGAIMPLSDLQVRLLTRGLEMCGSSLDVEITSTDRDSDRNQCARHYRSALNEIKKFVTSGNPPADRDRRIDRWRREEIATIRQSVIENPATLPTPDAADHGALWSEDELPDLPAPPAPITLRIRGREPGENDDRTGR